MFRKTTMHLVAACGLWAGVANAAEYNAMYVFGDSLSDRGNLAEGVGQKWIDPPSFHYSFTNGSVAVSVLADKLGLAADPSLWVTDFADGASLFRRATSPARTTRWLTPLRKQAFPASTCPIRSPPICRMATAWRTARRSTPS